MKKINKLFLLLIIANPLNAQITLAQTNDCPFIPNKKVTFGNAEVPLYRSPDLNSPTVYTIKPNLAFKLLEQSGQKINGLCWYKVELPLDKSVVWAGFKIAQNKNPKPSPAPTSPKPKITPQPSPNFTPANPKINTQPNVKPKSIKPNQNYSFYFYFLNIILSLFLLAFFLQIISSIRQQTKAKKLKTITEQSIQIKELNPNNPNHIPQITPVEPILTTSNPNQNSNPPIPYEQPREIDLGILNYLRINEQASFMDLLSHLKCDQQFLRDRLLILQQEEFIEIMDKSDENNLIYKIM